MVERWAEWAGEIVETLPDDVTAAQPDWQALEMQATVANAHVRDT